APATKPHPIRNEPATKTHPTSASVRDNCGLSVTMSDHRDTARGEIEEEKSGRVVQALTHAATSHLAEVIALPAEGQHRKPPSAAGAGSGKRLFPVQSGFCAKYK